MKSEARIIFETVLTILIFVIFWFMYCEVESMIESKSHDLTNLFLWWILLAGVVYIRFRKLINE